MTATSSTARSPVNELPSTPSNAKPDVGSSTVACCQAVPWLPLLLHHSTPWASLTRSVPIPEPYMLYQKVTAAASPAQSLPS